MKTVPSQYGRFNAPLQATFICDPVAPAECSGKVTLLPNLPVTGNGGNKAAPPPSLAAAVPPGGASIIVPSAVSASGLGGRTLFVSDGWLRNYSSSDLPVTLVYTPDSANGLTDSDVLKTERTLAPSSTLRLVDLVSGFFRTSGSGLVQIRSREPELLGLRTVVEAVTDGNPKTRYGTEIPTAAYRSGVGLGEGELVLPGIDDDTANRANLILSETSGAEAVVQITLNGPDGSSLGSITRTVPPYGKIQLNGIVSAVAPGRSLSGGWAGVWVTSGLGRVFPVATVIDNASSSFAAIRGRMPRANVTGVPVPASLIIPGPNGLNLGDGPFENVEIAARVTGGDGKLISFVTRNDNLSANPEIFVLTEPGPPQAGLSQ